MISITRGQTSKGNVYHVRHIPEATMISVLEGVQERIRKYNEDLLDPKFADDESTNFIISMIVELEEFVREAARYIVLSKDGQRMEIKH